MNRQPHDYRAHAPADGATPPAHGPYWTRAHRDWRVWVGAVLMALALSVFVLTGDLGWLYRAPRQQAPPAESPRG